MTKWHDWTAADGQSNSSQAFLDIVEAVGSILLNHRLGDDVAGTARLIVARLAHVHGLSPSASPEEASPEVTEKNDSETRVDDSQYGAPLATAATNEPVPTEDVTGLSIDMLDVDRLRQWANNIATYGPDVTHWASTGFVSDWLRDMADKLDTAVRDIGELRRRLRVLTDAAEDAIAKGDEENWRLYNGTDDSRLQDLEDALEAVGLLPAVDAVAKGSEVL